MHLVPLSYSVLYVCTLMPPHITSGFIELLQLTAYYILLMMFYYLNNFTLLALLLYYCLLIKLDVIAYPSNIDTKRN